MLTSRPQTGIPKLLLCKEKNVSSESEDISIGITGLAEWELPPEQLGRGLPLLTNRGQRSVLLMCVMACFGKLCKSSPPRWMGGGKLAK